MTSSTTVNSPASNEAAQQAASRLAVASQWQLVWWAFKKHRLAMAGLVVVACIH